MIGTLESYKKTADYFGWENICPIYLTLDDGERLLRAIERERRQKQPKYAELCRRYLADEEDFSTERLRQCGIERDFCNQDFSKCLDEVREYIKEEMGI